MSAETIFAWGGLVDSEAEQDLLRELVTKLCGVTLNASGVVDPTAIPWRDWYNAEPDSDDFWEHQLHEACHVAITGVRFAEEEATLLLEMMVLYTHFRGAILRFVKTKISWHSLFLTIMNASDNLYIDSAQCTWTRQHGDAYALAADTFKTVFRHPFTYVPVFEDSNV